MKTVRKNIKSFGVKILDAKTGTVIKEYDSMVNQSKERIAIDHIKATGKTAIEVEITEKNELREIAYDVFMSNSTVVPTKVIKSENVEVSVNE